MPRQELGEILSVPAARRPALMEGEWLGEHDSGALLALDPVDVLEGGLGALSELPAWLAWHARRHPQGAAIGFLSYELARFFEELQLEPSDILPELSFAYYPRIDCLASRNFSPGDETEPRPAEVRTNFDRDDYFCAIQEIQSYLASGDIYQANLTQQFRVGLRGRSAEEVYRRLSPSGASFRAFLKTPERTIVSNSPERFFRVSENRILSSPIKGTIRRGSTRAEDERRARELLASAKDRAENVMIVDLLRNDLGRICRYNTVRARLFEVVALPHLFHLVSHIEGELRSAAGVAEILRALFPCGSVTGAPKIRAIEILAAIEHVPRGVSMGALGVIVGAPGVNRFEMDFNVAIRTLVVEDKVAVFNVGGGIVSDSDPGAEYDEMRLKAQPLLAALGVHSKSEFHTSLAQVVER